MVSKLILALLLLLSAVKADESVGCQAGKLIKDPITGKITREVPKEEASCADEPEDILDVTPIDPFSQIGSDDEMED